MFLTLILLSASLQSAHSDSIPTPDTNSFVQKQSPHWWRAAGQVLGLNVGIQLADRYLLDLDYAHISGKTIADNIKYGWVWDNDDFIINQIGHPYQGSLYYSAARALCSEGGTNIYDLIFSISWLLTRLLLFIVLP